MDTKVIDINSAVVRSRLAETIKTVEAIAPEDISRVIALIEECAGTDRIIFVAGNGGSSTTASHFVCDLTKVVLGEKPYKTEERLKVISLSDSGSLVTAIANDISYERVFADQLENLARPGDVLIVLSYSGNSENILQVINSAHTLQLTTVGLLGKGGGKAAPLVDCRLIIPSDDCGIVEDAHLMIGHIITHYFKVKNGYVENPNVSSITHLQ